MPSGTKKSEYKTASNNNGSIPELMKELCQAAVNLRGSIEIRDAQTLDLIYEIPKGATRFAFSPDGTLLASGLNDGRIEYWGLAVK